MATISGIQAAQICRLCRLSTRVVEQIVEAKARDAARRSGKVMAVQYRALEFIHLHPGCCINDLVAGHDCADQQMLEGGFRYAYAHLKPTDAVVVGMFQKYSNQVA